MIIDITGVPLLPGNCGKDCPGNWKFAGIHCCCDACDYMMCCLETHDPQKCLTCKDTDYPRSPNCTDSFYQ